MTTFQIDLLKQAASQPDGTVLAIGYGQHSPQGSMKSFPTQTAMSLEKRGFLKYLKATSHWRVYQITDTGRSYLRSFLPPLMLVGKTKASRRFGFKNKLYSRNNRTAKWSSAFDVGVWIPITDAHVLEEAYQVWLRTASHTELNAAGIYVPRH